MFAVFECVAQAIKDKGLRGLCELVPGGSGLRLKLIGALIGLLEPGAGVGQLLLEVGTGQRWGFAR